MSIATRTFDESARARAAALVPDAADARQAQIAAYRDMPEHEVLAIEQVIVDADWLDAGASAGSARSAGKG